MMKIFNSENDLLSITDFASLVGVTAEALRHYDRTGAFTPAEILNKCKYKHRYYSPTQITSVKMVKVLSEVGEKLKFTLKI